MFRCQLCSCVVPPRTPARHVVVEKRPARYAGRPKAHLLVRQGKAQRIDDPGGSGYEIVREAMVCPDCARRNDAP